VVYQKSGKSANFERYSITPPVNLSFDVSFRLGGKETALGTLTREKGANEWVSFNLPQLPPKSSIDIILKPDPAAARQTVDIFDMWDGEVVLRGVPVD